jgi:hypothetical protein
LGLSRAARGACFPYHAIFRPCMASRTPPPGQIRPSRHPDLFEIGACRPVRPPLPVLCREATESRGPDRSGIRESTSHSGGGLWRGYPRGFQLPPRRTRRSLEARSQESAGTGAADGVDCELRVEQRSAHRRETGGLFISIMRQGYPLADPGRTPSRMTQSWPVSSLLPSAGLRQRKALKVRRWRPAFIGLMRPQ